MNACSHGKLFAGVSVTVRFSGVWYVYHGYGCLIKDGVVVFRITVVERFSLFWYVFYGLGCLFKEKNVLVFRFIVQELCESRGGRPELSVLTSLLASVDVKIY